ncbi:DUF433 domain-containing protein [Nitrosomonas sp.]|uniref:DUF433 domain-containing protein n=1 Tax=Nitrosomonas sp. TaxID=42353 RepID=UPI001DD129A7|nr:DUF433 domain-containing protein [Nitrosomonas sp.]MBX3618175.1 DUF433 domain-containing protein [Nitrosomonas sp.]
MESVKKQMWKNRIVTNAEILAGKPVIVGTRISVELILDCLASGWSVAEFIENYPHVSREDVLAALGFAANVIRQRSFVRDEDIKKGDNLDICP